MKAEIFHYHTWLTQIDPTWLRPTMDGLLSESGFQVLAVSEHHFSPQGYTCLWLLAESHLALHSFPEEAHTYIELSSCNAGKHRKFVDLLGALSVHAHNTAQPILKYQPIVSAQAL